MRSKGVFLCYRRADTADVAARLADRLIHELGEPRVFLDVSAIEGGVNFPLRLRDAIMGSGVMLVLIGPRWLSDAQGVRRLDEPQDHVRNEIKDGLRRGLLVIPVLVGGASMPHSSELPVDLAPLAELQALQITHPTYRHNDDVVVSCVVGHLRTLRWFQRPRSVLAALAVLVVLAGASLVGFRYIGMSGPGLVSPPTVVASAPNLPTVSAVPVVSSAPTVTSSAAEGPTAVVEPPPGTATIQADYDQPDGCRTTATITGDLRGDARAAGGVLWVVAVLDASPNVLYYPKVQVPAPGGHFSVTIDLNQTSGNRRGRFGLVVSPTEKARDDLQRSLDADIAKNDSAYTDDRRTRLQLGNIEIATTPFVSQQC